VPHAREGDLLDRIASDKACDDARLVYADWLDDHGRAAEAERIRAQIDHAQRAPRDLTAIGRAEASLPDLDRDWERALPRAARALFLMVEYRRGLPTRLAVRPLDRISADDWSDVLDALARLAPSVEHLALNVGGRDAGRDEAKHIFDALRGFPHLAHLELRSSLLATALTEARRVPPISALRLDDSHPGDAVGMLARALSAPEALRALRVTATSHVASDRDVQDLAHLSGLAELELSGFELDQSALARLADLPRLSHLVATLAADVDPAGLVGIGRLERLDCALRPGRWVPPAGLWPRLPGLVALTIDGADPLAATDLRAIAAAPGLRTLRLGAATPRRACDLDELAALPALVRLELGGATDDHLARLAVAVPHLRALRLADAAPSTRGLVALGRLGHLSWLALDARGAAGTDLVPLAHLPALDALVLGPDAREEGLRSLASCARLKWLDLERAQYMTPLGLAELARLPHLERLRLDVPAIEAAHLAAALRLPVLRQLELAQAPTAALAQARIEHAGRCRIVVARELYATGPRWVARLASDDVSREAWLAASGA